MTERKAERETERQLKKGTERPTDRQAGRSTNRQTDSQSVSYVTQLIILSQQIFAGAYQQATKRQRGNPKPKLNEINCRALCTVSFSLSLTFTPTACCLCLVYLINMHTQIQFILFGVAGEINLGRCST